MFRTSAVASRQLLLVLVESEAIFIVFVVLTAFEASTAAFCIEMWLVGVGEEDRFRVWRALEDAMPTEGREEELGWRVLSEGRDPEAPEVTAAAAAATAAMQPDAKLGTCTAEYYIIIIATSLHQLHFTVYGLICRSIMLLSVPVDHGNNSSSYIQVLCTLLQHLH